MKSFTTWALPVAVSLLLHASLLFLVTHQPTISSPDTRQVQTITVELSGKTTTSINKPRLQSVTPIVIEKPIQQPARTALPTAVNPVPEKPQTSTSVPEQTSTDKQAINTAAESQQAGMNIQPLSKLTRPPSFLRKIEPVYPRSEQRAGSQAYVLAEVTIDD